MKLLIAIYILTISFSTFSDEIKRNIVVLNALHNVTQQTILGNKKVNTNKVSKKIFNQTFNNSSIDLKYNLIFIDNAKQKDLEDVLQDPKTLAIYWISHSSGTNSDAAVKTPSIILDHDNNNIAPIFKNIHKNIKVVAIIGCYSKEIIKKYYSEGHYRNNKQLKFISYSKTISLVKGINQAIFDSSSKLSKVDLEREFLLGETKDDGTPNSIVPREKYIYFKQYSNRYLAKQKGVKVEIWPSSNLQFPIQIMADKYYLGSIYPGEVSKEIVIPLPLITKKIKLIFSSGHTFVSLNNNILDTTFDITSKSYSFNVSYFAKRNSSNPFGKYKHIYYLNELEISSKRELKRF